jgi:hypothetical protein
MLCIDIFTIEIYVVTSRSFINLIRLLQILLKMAGIRVCAKVNSYVKSSLGTESCAGFISHVLSLILMH